MSATLLIANRGEIALRIIRTATELGIQTVAVYAEDDADGPHVHAADEAIGLPGAGPDAYLDQRSILAAAKKCGAELIHPGYGFLSENAEFARAVMAAGYTFVGPDADALASVGNKSSARAAAIAAGVPVLPATEGPAGIEEVRAFFAARDGPIMIKALAGGGVRGMRKVVNADQIDNAYQQYAAEARLGFGDPALFAEAALDAARHIEVQVVGAPAGHQTHALALGDRDCSIQRRYQKLVEIAPAQGLSDALRRELHRASARLCARVGLRGVATVEFLLTGESFVFLEINPRIQVEHTVTEETTGVDLVAVQLAIAGGASYCQLGLPSGIASDGSEDIGEPAAGRGSAKQRRVNAESFAAERPRRARRHVWPAGPGHQPAVRLTAGQGHHPCARIVVAGGGAQGPQRAGRIRHRGRSHERLISARAAVGQSASVGLGDDGFSRREAARVGDRGIVSPARHPVHVGRALPGRGSAARAIGGHRGRGGGRRRRVRCRRPTDRPRGDEDAACARRAGRAADSP